MNIKELKIKLNSIYSVQNKCNNVKKVIDQLKDLRKDAISNFAQDEIFRLDADALRYAIAVLQILVETEMIGGTENDN